MTQEASMIEKIKVILKGIDQTEIESEDGWWETSTGAKLGAEALKQILELLAQTQEPVAWQFFQNGKWHNGMEVNDHRKHTEAVGVPVRDLYTTLPQRTWVGLTDEDICTFSMWLDDKSDVAVFTAIEAKLKQKNGYAEEKNNGV
jgi:hypothetical protein